MSDIVMLYITCPSLEVAHAIGKQLIQSKLAACANILPAITSLYEWQGKLEQAAEVAMLVKTTSARAHEAKALIASTHPHDCPCVVQLPVCGGHAPFLDWINQQTLPV